MTPLPSGVPPLPSEAPPLPPRPPLVDSVIRRNSPTCIPISPSSYCHEKTDRKSPIVPMRDPAIPLPKPKMLSVPKLGPAIPLPKPKVMTLQELANSYSDELPVSVTAQSGYYGKNSNMQLSADETFFIHLMKTTEVVHVVAAGQDIDKYSIPINSSCQLSLIYNPHENVSEALQGYVFKGVMKLASANPLPKVVTTLTAWDRGNTVIEMNEILVVRGINSNKELEVFNMKSNQIKLLPFKCQSKFTTDPRLLYMYLLDIIDNIPGAFPCQHQRQPLLCSYPGTNDHFELPVDLPNVTVTICENDETVKFQLYETTKNIISEYNPAYATCCRDDVAKDVYETQSKMYAAIRKGYENKGVHLKFSEEIVRQMEGTAQNTAHRQEQLERNGMQEPKQSPYATLQNDIPDGHCMEEVKRTNKDYLASLSEEMVIDVLHSMGLSQYEEAFRGITGAAMCKLTVEMLECQLGVKSKLHQIRLMKIVLGEKDVRSV
eukprot:Em0003g1232a